MAASSRRDLFVNIGGSASELSVATKAGKSALLDLNQATGSIVDQISENMKKIGASANAPLADLERNFKSSLNNIRGELRSLSASGDQGAMLKFFDQNSINQQIAQGERLSAQYRMIAEAAQEVSRSGGANADAARVWAASYGTLAAQTELETQKLREQAGAQAEVLGKMTALPAAANAVTTASGAQKAGFQQLAYNINDVTTMYGMHASAQQIFISQSGQILQSLLLITQGGSGWLATLGQFAPAILILMSVLTPLITALLKGNDALQDGIDKLKKDAAETEASRLAKVAYNRTLEGQIALQRELNDELDRSIRSQRQIQQNNLRDSQVRLDQFKADRPKLIADIETQQATVNRLRNFSPASDPYGTQAQALADAQARLAELRAKLTKLDDDIARTTRGIREAQVPLIQDDVSARFDKMAAAARAYTIALGNLNQQLAIGAGKKETRDFYLPDGTFEKRVVTGISPEEYARQFKIIGEKRKADEKAAREAEREGANRMSGREVTPAEAAGIARSAGLQVNSSGRTYGEQKRLYDEWVAAGRPKDNPVAPPGTSAHEGAKGRWALDIQFAPGVTPDLLRKVFADQGVTLSKVFKERGHWHVEGSRSQADGSASAADAAAQKELERRAALERELGDETEKAVGLGRALAATDEDRLDVKLATIQAEKENRDKALAGRVTTGKLTQAEADQLKAINARIADEKASIATNQAVTENRRKLLETERAEYDAKMTLLRYEGDLALTNRERAENARKALALEFENRQRMAEIMAASHDPREAAQGLRDLAALPAERAVREKVGERQAEGPLAKYRDELKGATDDMDEALQGVAVHGLQTLEDGLLGVINGTKSVGQAFKEMAASIIADLARIAIEKAVIKGIESLIGLSTGSVGGSNEHGFATGVIPGFAAGVIRGPGTGTSDSILAVMHGRGLIRVSNGESIITADATRRYGPLLKAMNDNTLPRFATGLVPNIAYPKVPDAATLTPPSVQANLTYHIDARGADASAIAQLRSDMEKMKADLPAQVLGVVVDARNRLVLRG